MGKSKRQLDVEYIGSRILFGSIVVLSSFMVFLAFRKPFDHDEFAYLHVGWYIKRGFFPYKDFFEHHHALHAHILALLIAVFGETTSAILVVRMLSVLLALGLAGLTYRITFQLTQSKFFSMGASFLLFTADCYLTKALEIRPDLLQIFLVLLSLSCFLEFVKSGEQRNLDRAALSAATSFLVLQKSFFFMIALLVAVVFYCVTGGRKRWFSLLARFSFYSMVPPILLLIYQWHKGALHDYFLFCWTLNTRWIHWWPPWYLFLELLSLNPLLMGISVVCAAYAISPGENRYGVRCVLLFLVAALLLVFTVKIPYRHHFVILVPLIAVVIGWASSQWNPGRKTVWFPIACVVGLLCWFPVGAIERNASPENTAQLQVVKYVLDHTAPDDLVYDGDANFNVFRRDPNFFWFSTAGHDEFQTYARALKGIAKESSVCQIIQDAKPKIMSLFRLRLDQCELHDLYKPIAFGLYERRT